jgi:L-ascorbate metabolism protein UlaG (beta-lactamase superfamily)
MLKILGKNPNPASNQRIRESLNYLNGNFQNLQETRVLTQEAGFFKMLGDFIKGSDNRTPKNQIPTKKSNLQNSNQAHVSITWFGHSSYHINWKGFNILVDPVMIGYASPFPGMINAFKGTDVFNIADIGPIDLLIITHDHYDHLDYHTLVKLKTNTKQVCCSLGVASHLIYWGFSPEIINELDWWETLKLENGMKLTATPARHFSGRSLKRAQTLWSAFMVEYNGQTIFIGGDSGYGDHFKKIGETFPKIDLAILECGQYNEKWPNIHMLPEETVQAHLDLKADVLFPVHWGKFALAYHPWNEPVTRLTEEATQLKIDYSVPMIGETFQLGENLPVKEWWV